MSFSAVVPYEDPYESLRPPSAEEEALLNDDPNAVVDDFILTPTFTGMDHRSWAPPRGMPADFWPVPDLFRKVV